jgi:predicted YcjX-like family ATPase
LQKQKTMEGIREERTQQTFISPEDVPASFTSAAFTAADSRLHNHRDQPPKTEAEQRVSSPSKRSVPSTHSKSAVKT